MSSPPQLSERDIQAHIDAQSFTRGRRYANAGHIIHPRRQGNTLKALCVGSMPEPYQLSATIAAGAIQAECSCPVGYGGHCKHVAAMLLTWMTAPEQFTEVEDLRTMLEDKSKGELIDLLIMIAAGNPQVELLLETAASGDPESAAANPAFYRQQVETALGPSGYGWDPYGGYGHRGNLPAIVAQGDAMAGRDDWRGAGAVYQGVLDVLIESGAIGYDEEGEFISIASRCVEGLGDCLAHLSSPADREPLLQSLFAAYRYDMEDLGGVGMTDGVQEFLIERTTPEEREQITGWLRRAAASAGEWASEVHADLLIELQIDELDDEAYLSQCREFGLTGRLVERLLELGRHDEAFEAAAETDVSTLSRLLPIFTEFEQVAPLEALVERRLAEHDFAGLYGIQMQLAEWLQKRYKQRGDFAAALPIALQSFRNHPSMDNYHEVRELATETGEWAATRPDLLAWMAGRAPDLKVQIHLDEGELDKAIAAVRAADRRPTPRFYGFGYDMPLRVAEAVAGERPEATLEIYTQRAEQLIDLRGRENYQTSATLLGRARDLYERLDRSEEWDAYIARLRSEPPRLRALREELDRAGL